jgi:hypothetical protein
LASDTTGYWFVGKQHPGGMPEARAMSFWHPSGMHSFFYFITGGGARQASLNHRLISFKPPACGAAANNRKNILTKN